MTDLRGSRPDAPQLTWRLLGRAFPRYAGVYVPLLFAIRLVFLALPHAPHEMRTLTVAAVFVTVTLTVLDPWLRKQIGLTGKAERREQTWSSSHEVGQLASRQALRFLVVAWPIYILAIVVSSVLVGGTFRLLGWK